ncbi:hypothetical protein A2331_06730 [Candidatus Falkowbacteria bacterium RIFOXYB2_FULL_34_18]|uniref:histidine kinase n=1 Tax=Candidatus Falkowbacteria bacterium RIFOXYD2_FULL_34_120 TaxID=1798007 RepID=A0A1F5TRS9_9BACT|nr:MAG: hypothetical protein A2331_06730 [Candidatus Falkowbacteria bacterium RIFOXYB2_FULL_34_18]OGF29984.1 MAG: hypothetical protein A2500_03950 [Candidatus Falkowbacteria bacterium RIFOXYC12_FULL_34_55]OGF37159.1 MAG: hypothetical protein A2466_02570 [Candidatus Falkowbacteria bacterium RIFOXYC2_FULL_34_220]OGF39520.1 MAG: hypothetical protein A2515_04315 [Candidatus Falkowbacteria bacterium RIFOXYD12_FULL_34_57]OGF41497.1 MAG: hypothetical protein A2531_02285 [Candidatus Falkowbacteria bact
MRISDKILLIVFVLATVLVLVVALLIGGSLQQVLLLGQAVYIFVFITSFMISRKLSQRIISLSFNVEEMAAGNFSKKIEIDSRDEIGQLASALNDLLSRLRTNVAIDVSKDTELAKAKTDFVTLASHQLRTPLSIIKWYVDFLVTGEAGEINKEQKKYLEEVYLSNERLIELVNALLDVSRIDVGTFSIEPEPTDIVERAENALRKYLPQIKQKEIHLKKAYDDIPKINLDPRLTKMVFDIVISNAVKYTNKGGMIKITIKKTENNILTQVSDSGCGIPREQQPKVFSKLFRADNVRRMESVGTGLGLYIAKAVIEKSGGKIWFESPSLEFLLSEEYKGKKITPDKANKGTTIFFTIPLKGMKKKLGTKKLSSL